MFCLITFIWTRKKQLCKPCLTFLTKLSKSFSHQLWKQFTKNLLKELFSIITSVWHVKFNYGVFVEYLTKFRINFVSNPTMVELESFCLEKYAFPKNVSRTRRIHLWQTWRKNYIKYPYSFSKTPKTKIDWSTVLFGN